mmetsp:Transcript_68631/g.108870  ORF Transcript_68631/g.108870 Transcript_68631/m.108870 type:complete len:159 (+) Transcript_68631:87-563(+)
MLYIIIGLFPWVYAVSLSVKSSRTDPAQQYVETWKARDWHMTGCDGDANTFPSSTQAMIAQKCGKEVDGTDHCVCMVAKAHSCYISCKDHLGPRESGIREDWIQCMADCYPRPTCSDMCAEGTSTCKVQCIKRYRDVVKPFWNSFEGSSTDVTDYQAA